MTPQDLIIRRISLNRFISERVVKYVALHPFLFTKQRMMDPEDDTPIRIKYFGVFQQKNTLNKKNVQRMKEIKDLITNNVEYYLKVFDNVFSTEDELMKYIRKAYRNRVRADFEEIYEKVVNNKG